MASFEPWDVVKVPFPCKDRPVVQRRPALVLACFSATSGPPLLWVAMITSATHRHWDGDVEIADLRAAGLPAPSMARLAKLATIEAQVADPLGRLAEPERQQVRHWLRDSLAPLLLED